MVAVLYQGFFEALAAGLLEGSPDLRCTIGMEGFTYDVDSTNIADGTLDEYDGANFVEIDLDDVLSEWDSTADGWRVTCTGGSFGVDPLEEGDSNPAYLVVYLWVDGTAANDYLLASITTGLGSVAGGQITLTVPEEGIFFGRQAD